jgi:hypothetical protein
MFAGLNMVLAQESPANKATNDLFIGNYVGTFEPQKPSGGKPKPEDSGKAKAQKCGSCHAEASVSRSEKEYVLTLVVVHGKDKKGNPNLQRFTLKGQPAKEGLVFQDANYTITVTDGKLTGGRTGKVTAVVNLERKPESETKPPTPAAK